MIRLSLLAAGLVLAIAVLAMPDASAASTPAVSAAPMSASPAALPCGMADHRNTDCAAACNVIAALPLAGEATSPISVVAPAVRREAMPRGATLAPDPPPPRPLARP